MNNSKECKDFYLQVWLGAPESNDVLAGILEQKVLVVQHLHLPDPERPEAVKVLEEAPQLLQRPCRRPPVEEDEEAVLEHVDGLLPEGPVHEVARQRRLLVGGERLREQQVVVLVEGAPDLQVRRELAVLRRGFQNMMLMPLVFF